MREYSFGISQDLECRLSDESLARLVAAGTPVRLAPGQLLYRQGDPASDIYLLVSGSMKSFIVNGTGIETVLRIHLARSVLGLTAMASQPWRDASGVALEPSEAVGVSRTKLQALIGADPQIGIELLQLLVDRMRDFHFRVGILHAESVEQRLARVLLALSRRDPLRGTDGATVPLAITHQDLADMISTRRQTVTQMLGRFTASGFIERRGRQLRIRDVAGLQAIVGERP
jgi:CRP-like cAMP-binding protein